MIRIERSDDTPWYKDCAYLGTIRHSQHGVAVGVCYDYKSTLPVRRYLCGLEPANYPVPTTRVAQQG